MSIKRGSYLVISLCLTSVIALAQQPSAPPQTPLPPGESLTQGFSLFVEGGGFLGVYAEDINKENMGRYGLREARGTGITNVIKGSPAEKAGLKKDDVILRFDGETVTSVRKLNRLVSEVAPDQTVRLNISRGGSEQEVAVTIAKRKDYSNFVGDLQGMERLVGPHGGIWGREGDGPGKDGFVFAFGNNRRIGISTTQLTKQLAEYFGVADGTGVLVTSVGEDSPAAKAGIKAGDIITAVDGEKLDSAGDLSRAINKKKDGDVTLTIIRNKSQRTITVTPKTDSVPQGQPGSAPQVGRRVMIPRIELPSIPEINVVVPGIELPAIPEINVVLPRINPKVRVKRLPAPQPI
jgi:membrane-associated protease RseP (regulator of RpoE activity)